MANSYLDVVEAVKNYYGSGSDQWVEIAKYGVRPDNIDIVRQVPGVNVYTYTDGSIANIVYDNPLSTDAPSIAEITNSNVQSGTFSQLNTFNAPVPVNSSLPTGSTDYAMESGSTVASTGTKIGTVARALSVGISAVMAGCRLGKFFAQQTYDQNPNYWDEHLPTMNPETWSSIAGDNKLGQKVMQFLFGINPDTNETTAYMDENAFAYMAYAMKQLGMFSTTGEHYESTSDILTDVYVIQPVIYGKQNLYESIAWWQKSTDNRRWQLNRFVINDDNYSTVSIQNQYVHAFIVASNNPNVHVQTWGKNVVLPNDAPQPDFSSSEGFTIIDYDTLNSTYTYNGKTVYYRLFDAPSGSWYWGDNVVENTCPVTSVTERSERTARDIAWIMVYGESKHISGLPDGVSNQPGAIQPDTSTWTDPGTTKQSLKQQNPSWWDNAIYNDVPQEDGSLKRYTYIPVPTIGTSSANERNPTNETVTKDQTKVNPSTSNDNLLKTIVQYLTNTTAQNPTPPNTENPPDTGEGDSPVIVMPTGEASALWSVYNPTQSQLNSFGSWLWSSDFFSQLKKLFNDPMQAIIGVHKVFATPQVSGQATIKCGYIDSEVPSNVVGSQYAIVDCGTVSLREYFGNVFDYAPYTEVKLFLPFIGVVPLDTSYVMRGSISVTYHVDVITGACLAEVSVRRDSAGGIIYTFGGSCIVQYPVSSGSYMSVISGVLGTVASGVMAGVSIGTGNPIGAVYGISGAAQSILNTHTNVQHSGGFTGCTGAMGGKKPYLIISRPQTELNGHEPHMSGLPSNDYIALSSRRGFIKCKHVHVTGIDYATASEKDEIERLLKQGVMI